jgi:uncharacterized protein
MTTPDSPAISALKRFYEAEAHYVSSGGDDFAPVSETLDPDIIMIQAESLPFGGEWRGHDGFESWMKAFESAWTSATAKDVRFIEQGDTVVVVATMEATARKTGERMSAPICHVVRVADGRLAEFRVFYWDTAATLRALGQDRRS